jgi:hypothetical protein
MAKFPINYYEITSKSIDELNLPNTTLNKKLLPFLKGNNIEFSSINEIADFFKKKKGHTYIYLCPYCNKNGLYSTLKPEHPSRCSECGETEPIDKLTIGLEKVQNLLKLAVAHDEMGDLHTSRILYEECITLLATSIEVFLKDIYCVTLNLEYVKSSKSLFTFFYNNSRNEFLNMGKAKYRFEDHLKIDFKFLNEGELKKLNQLMLKRHCIVHNLGISDKSFIEQSGLKVKLGELLPISYTEIEEDIILINKLQQGLYNHLYLKMKENMKENLTKLISILPES